MDKLKNNTLFKYGSLCAELILYYLLFVVKKVISFGLISHITMIILILLNFYYFYKKSLKDLKFKRNELDSIRRILMIQPCPISGFCLKTSGLQLWTMKM